MPPSSPEHARVTGMLRDLLPDPAALAQLARDLGVDAHTPEQLALALEAEPWLLRIAADALVRRAPDECGRILAELETPRGPGLVMDLIEGPDLSELLARGPCRPTGRWRSSRASCTGWRRPTPWVWCTGI